MLADHRWVRIHDKFTTSPTKEGTTLDAMTAQASPRPSASGPESRRSLWTRQTARSEACAGESEGGERTERPGNHFMVSPQQCMCTCIGGRKLFGALRAPSSSVRYASCPTLVLNRELIVQSCAPLHRASPPLLETRSRDPIHGGTRVPLAWRVVASAHASSGRMRLSQVAGRAR